MKRISVIQSKPGRASAVARHQARLIGSEILDIDPNRLRLAYASPSGRPVLMLDGRLSTLRISLSHLDHYVGIAVDDRDPVGIDLVSLSDASGLQSWLQNKELKLVQPAWSAFEWAARESAFKALSIDRVFVPDEFEIRKDGKLKFQWSFITQGHYQSGVGKFMLQNDIVCALAWSPTQPGEERT